MTTSRSLYRKYTVAGPGGMSCPCCAPQSGDKYKARARAKVKRQAIKRYLAIEERYERRAEVVSDQAERIEELKETAFRMYHLSEQDLQRQRESYERRAKVRARYVGHVEWVQDPQYADTWVLIKTEVEDPYGDDYHYFDSAEVGLYVVDIPLAKVEMHRDRFLWQLWFSDNPDDYLLLDMMEHSLDTLKDYVLTVNKLS